MQRNLELAQFTPPLGHLDPFTVDDAATHGRGRGSRGQRGRARKMMVRRASGTVAMESHKQKLNGRGRGLVEPTDVRLEREIAGKVGNNKKWCSGRLAVLAKCGPKW